MVRSRLMRDLKEKRVEKYMLTWWPLLKPAEIKKKERGRANFQLLKRSRDWKNQELTLSQ